MKPVKKVLIAYDGTPCSEAALEDLRLAGLPAATSVLVVSVGDVFLPAETSIEEFVPAGTAAAVQREWDHASDIVGAARQLAEKAAGRIKAAFPKWEVGVEAFADSPAWGILRKAKDWNADLIIVGAHGMPSSARLMLGSISQRIVGDAHCSVRVVHSRPPRAETPLRIVLGLDGSIYAQRAVEEAASRDWPKGTEIHLVTVIDSRLRTSILVPGSVMRKHSQEHRARDHWSGRLMEPAAEELRARGLSVTRLNKEGDARKLLLEEADRWKADCIFLGARGLSGIKHFLIGSVSSAIAARARCTVEIVRLPAAA